MNESSRIVELVGPPGSGKTTLADALHKRTDQVLIADAPYFRRIGYIPFFVKNLLMLLPTILDLQRKSAGGGFTSRDVALMIILEGWPRLLRRQIRGSCTTIVLDEGCICLLARLHGFGSNPIRSQSARKWWHHMCEQWAETLNAVIQLDTPVPVLLKRIRAREMQYEMKEMSDQDALKHLASIRAAQDYTLATMIPETQRAKIRCFNTVEKSPEQICDEVLITFGLKHGKD